MENRRQKADGGKIFFLSSVFCPLSSDVCSLSPVFYPMLSVTHYLLASAVLFTIGLAGVVTRRNILMILLSVEIMLNAANLAFIAYARAWADLTGQIMVFFVIIVAAAEVTVGLAIAVLLARRLRTLNADDIRLMKW